MAAKQAPKADTRFKKGQSGNPKGRPRKEPRAVTLRQIRHDYLKAMERPVTIRLNGKKKTVPIDIAIFEQLLNQAAQGTDLRATKMALEYRRELVREHEAAQVMLAETLVKLEELRAKNPSSFDAIDMAFLHEMRRRVYDPYALE